MRFKPPKYPPTALTKSQRRALFEKCSTGVQELIHEDHIPYPTGFFMPPDGDIRREDAIDWLLWALFACNREDARDEWKPELDEYVVRMEALLGRKLEDGRGANVKSLRLTLDPVVIVHRPLIWYSVSIWNSLRYQSGFDVSHRFLC